MRSTYATRRGPSAFFWLVLAIVVVFAGVGTTAVLGYFEIIQLPFFNYRRAPDPPPSGTVPVFKSIKTIPAYTAIHKDHIFAPSGAFKVDYLTPEQIESQGILPHFSQFLGRVLKYEMREGYAFREKDFLPLGTRSGLAGGVEEGKRALVVEAGKIQGCFALRRGDRFDLLASLSVDPHSLKGPGSAGIPNVTGQKKLATVEVLVQNGYVVAPVTTRQLPGQGKQSKPVQEIVIAVEPGEVSGLTKALAEEGQVYVALRSGRPNESEFTTEITSSPPPAPHKIEVISGSKSETKIFYPGQGGQ